MTQATATRGPRGWDRVVAQLNAATELTAINRGMLDLQCKIVAAEYGTLWTRDSQGNPTPLEAWPKPLSEIPSDNPMMQLLAQAAKSGFERGASHVLKAEAENAQGSTPAEGEIGAHIFVTVLRHKGQIAGVTTVVAECRDAQVLQTTAPMRELAAGLYEGFFARREAVEHQQDSQRVRSAMAMLAVSQEAEGFNGACLNLVNELARQLKCTRVSLGWVRGKGIRLIAMSDTEHLKRHSDQVAMLELGMAECVDQQQPLIYPVPDDAEPLLRHAVVHAHRRLTQNHQGRYTASLPLRHRDEWIGVITLERLETPFDSDLIRFLQLVVDVIAPHLNDRKHSDRFLVGHAWHSVEKTSAYLIGPRHTAWKLAALLGLAVLTFVVFGRWDYRVSAPFVFEAHARRFLPVPYESQLRAVHVEPGDKVVKDQVLAEMDDTELRLQLSETTAKLRQAEFEWSKNLNEAGKDPTKMADAKQSEANILQMKAHIELLNYLVSRAQIRAPVDGRVLSGQWKDKVGGVLKQGDQMFEVAPLGDLVALVHVPDSDIDLLMGKPERSLIGDLTTRSEPEHRFPIKVDRIVPSAAPVNGVNAFEVRAVLTGSDDPEIAAKQDWLRPGMEGLAKIDVGSKPIWWILTHRIVDTVRLWIWW